MVAKLEPELFAQILLTSRQEGSATGRFLYGLPNKVLPVID